MLQYHVGQYQYQWYHAQFSLQGLTIKKVLEDQFQSGHIGEGGSGFHFLQRWRLIHGTPVLHKIRPGKPVDFIEG